MSRLEKHLVDEKPSLVLVPGDTNSALAGALTPVKLGIPVAHVEAGARYYDMKMAEEVNRRLIDHCSEILFAPTVNCRKNLEKESVLGKIHLTGDTMYDAFLKFKDRVDRCDILERLELADREYFLITLHRVENVDDPTRLRSILKGVGKAKMKIIFPIHPRTANRLKEYNISLEHSNIQIIDPLSYIEMLKLLKYAKVILTDSGGVQKEAFWSKIPCITLRDSTEWIETVDLGVNQITGADAEKIVQAIRNVEDKYDEIKERFKGSPFGEGDAAKKIVEILKERVKEEK